MGLLDQVQKEIATAMKAKEALRLGALRMLKTALLNKKVERGAEAVLSEEEELAVVKSLVKQRREAADEYRKGDRPELAEKEEQELAFLESYLPAAVGEEEIRKVVDEAVAQTGATTTKDMGKVMGVVMGKFKGQNVDGKLVNQLVKKRLGS